jgi:pyrroline-5-carboxylate reductase
MHGTIGFVGGGNMAAALIGGLIERGTPAARIRVADPNGAACERLIERFSVAAGPELDAALAACETIVLATKPQQVREACHALAARGPLPGVVISIAAGVRSADVARWLPAATAVIRSMPNTPALIGRGITALFAAGGVGSSQREQARALFSAVGEVLWVEDEALLDVVTAVSGSGPAYFFYFMEALEKSARQLGLGEVAAHQLALQTCAGAAALALHSAEPLATLRERVTSKGGTTHAALEALSARAVGEAIDAAVRAASARSRELGDEFGRG